LTDALASWADGLALLRVRGSNLGRSLLSDRKWSMQYQMAVLSSSHCRGGLRHTSESTPARSAKGTVQREIRAPERADSAGIRVGVRGEYSYSTNSSFRGINVTTTGAQLFLLSSCLSLFFAVRCFFYLCFSSSVTGTVLPSLTSMPRLTT